MEGFVVPSLFRIGKYIIYFWSNENDEPIHVHIGEKRPTSTGGCILANNNSRIPQRELDDLLDIISAQFFMICSKWKDHFCVDSIKFYC